MILGLVAKNRFAPLYSAAQMSSPPKYPVKGILESYMGAARPIDLGWDFECLAYNSWDDVPDMIKDNSFAKPTMSNTGMGVCAYDVASPVCGKEDSVFIIGVSSSLAAICYFLRMVEKVTMECTQKAYWEDAAGLEREQEVDGVNRVSVALNPHRLEVGDVVGTHEDWQPQVWQKMAYAGHYLLMEVDVETGEMKDMIKYPDDQRIANNALYREDYNHLQFIRRHYSFKVFGVMKVEGQYALLGNTLTSYPTHSSGVIVEPFALGYNNGTCDWVAIGTKFGDVELCYTKVQESNGYADQSGIRLVKIEQADHKVSVEFAEGG